MPFLANIGAWILAKIILPIIESAIGSLVAQAAAWIKSLLWSKAKEKQTEAAKDESNKAQTDEERAKAADDTRSNW